MRRMLACHVVEIVTPKKILLNGLWFGPRKPKRVIVWVHGMFSSAFSLTHVVEKLIDTQTAILTFNNRGFEVVSDVKQIVGKNKKWIRAGTAHELFTDCVDDIEGAIRLAKKSGVKNIFLAGHSTGCQKIVYWAQKGNGVRGLILLGPLSDYAGTSKHPKFKKALALAEALKKRGRGNELLPEGVWWHHADARRFLSLYTPNSIEQLIFPYFDSRHSSSYVKNVRTPILSLFAGSDEYADRPAKVLARWFEAQSGTLKTILIPNVGHSFRGGEIMAARAIKAWIKGLI